ncbi:ABC transporter substrate-binding protein [Flexithrix dorotheae]|uniref:ABC transporter substrate-binding protein n=1 Tax=Flexithrix dorotheae TaxID=70993 RepID=UPI00036D6FCF|nr:helical backbone metal receptor [Flexithrix dorotheae]
MIFKDQLNREVMLEGFPKRIISLVPSTTETLFDLGLENEVIGITKFCKYPKDKLKGCLKVGGTKTFHFDRVEKLQPDLIIANKEENRKEDIEALEKQFPVWVSDICNIVDSQEMIRSIGGITNRQERATKIITDIDSGFERITQKLQPKKVLYFIWRNPYMVAGKGTFIDSILTKIGFENIAPESRYPKLDQETIEQLNKKVDLILLSSEPFPFKEKYLAEFQEIFPGKEIRLVDGEMFCWPGSRLKYASKYLLETFFT